MNIKEKKNYTHEISYIETGNNFNHLKYINCSNVQYYYILLTACIYSFRIILTINSWYFPEQHNQL